MEKIVASFLDDEGNLQFVGVDGTILLVDDVGRQQAGDPSIPTPPTDDHWYQDGEGISAYFSIRDVTASKTLQVLRVGRYLHGSLAIPKSDVNRGEELRLMFDGAMLPWQYAGLATTFCGWATYRNNQGKDAFVGHAKWADPAMLVFEFPERGDPWKFGRLRGGYPENWGHYGLILEWGIGIY